MIKETNNLILYFQKVRVHVFVDYADVIACSYAANVKSVKQKIMLENLVTLSL